MTLQSPTFTLIPVFLAQGTLDADFLGPVVQSIVSLTSSLRGQLIKCFKTLLPNILIFFVEKNERSFCTAKASHIFSTKNTGIFEILIFEILMKC